MNHAIAEHQSTGLNSDLSGAFFRFSRATLMSELDLSVTELGQLLGGIPERTLSRYFKAAEANESVELNRDVYERQSLLLGIYKAIKLSAPDTAGAVQHFFTVPSDYPMFNGMSVKDYLLANNSILFLYQVRRFYDAKRG